MKDYKPPKIFEIACTDESCAQ